MRWVGFTACASGGLKISSLREVGREAIFVLLARGDATMADEAQPAVPVSQEALAMMLGMTRQTLSKELKVLVAEGAVLLRYRRIEITCAVRLKALSDPSR
jgi:CRP-like cAMP-binding protein